MGQSDDFFDEALYHYVSAHSQEESELLRQLRRKTHLHQLMPRMLSGNIQGNFLTMLVQLIQPKRVLEIGTYTGYATICMATALPEDGVIFTIEKSEELASFSAPFFEASGCAKKIIQVVEDAAVAIPTLNEQWDMVFLDADKANNQRYYDMFIDNVKPGGLILADNVLWDHKVYDDEIQDALTKKIRDFNHYIQEDSRVTNLLLPLRDGIMMMRKV